jgi:two-component system cell cycle sensor histidine kinase/response regulator CckA
MPFTSPFTPEFAGNPWETTGMSAKVLVVEDNDVVSDCLQAILRAYGYNPILATNPEQAAEHCRNERCAISALIADVRLGNSHGFEMALSLNKICPEMKVIFTSGDSYEYLVQTGLLPAQLGAAVFLQKPFRAGDVISSLKVSAVPDLLH